MTNRTTFTGVATFIIAWWALLFTSPREAVLGALLCLVCCAALLLGVSFWRWVRLVSMKNISFVLGAFSIGSSLACLARGMDIGLVIFQEMFAGAFLMFAVSFMEEHFSDEDELFGNYQIFSEPLSWFGIAVVFILLVLGAYFAPKADLIVTTVFFVCLFSHSVGNKKD